MRLPKQPFLLAAVIAHLVIALTARGLAARLEGRPCWVAVVVGVLLLPLSLSIADQRYTRSEEGAYPFAPLWLAFGLVPAAAVALFWSGLTVSGSAPDRSPTATAGLCGAAAGVLLALLLAARRGAGRRASIS